MKIYASLVNISQGNSRQDQSNGKSEGEEEVFLNDF